LGIWSWFTLRTRHFQAWVQRNTFAWKLSVKTKTFRIVKEQTMRSLASPQSRE